MFQLCCRRYVAPRPSRARVFLIGLGVATVIGLVIGLVSNSWAVEPVAASGPADREVDDRLTPPSGDWPWWRGPQRNGWAEAQQSPPTTWSASEGILWKVKVPGKGHGSPTVAGNLVILQIGDSDRDVQAVAAYSRSDGTLVWETIVHRGGLEVKNSKSSAASSTVAVAEGAVFANFLNAGAVYTTALGLETGEIRWQAKICDYTIHQGYGSSPTLYQNLAIVVADNKAGGALMALDRASGEVVWQRQRPKTPNYPSPVIVHVDGRDQLIMTGCERVSSYSPRTGETLWEIKGATTECVTSTVTDGTYVFSSGGYPKNHMAAIRADGSGDIGWENRTRVYVPSLLCKDGYLYGILDAGVASCWKSDTGEERWKKRLGGTFTSSPVLVGDSIYAWNEAGEVFVFLATPDEFTLVAENQLGDEVYATPAICGGKIYQRVAFFEGDTRQEYLVCLGSDH